MSSGVDVIMGVVSRFSNSGNAMLQTDDGQEWNVGPLPEFAEGERIRVRPIDDLWAVCIEHPYATEEYLEEMRSRTDSSQLDDLQLSTTDSSADVEDVGKVITTTYDSSGLFSKYDDGKPVSVSLPDILNRLSFRNPLPARIVFVRRGIAVAVPALDSLPSDEIASGDLVTVDVEAIVSDGEGIVGFDTQHNLPIVASDVVGFENAMVKLGVVDVFGTHVHASPSALPDEVLPSVGEVLFVDVVRSLPDGTARGFHEGIPTVIHEALGCLGVAEPFKMAVTEYEGRGVSVSVQAVPEEQRPDTGDSVECTVITPYEDGTLCRVEDYPLWISDTVPTPVSSLQVAVVAVNQSHLLGSIRKLPRVHDLNQGTPLSLEIQLKNEEAGIGSYHGVPIVVPSGQVLKGHTAKFGVKEVKDAYVVAGVDALSDTPKKGDVITFSNENRREGNVFVIDELPFILPSDSGWPTGEVRLGVSGVGPMGVKLSVTDIPPEQRLKEGDEIELCHSDVDPRTRITLIDGIPVQVPEYEWTFRGPLRLGVDQVQSNCVTCSVGGLQSTPHPGEFDTVSIDETIEEGCGGRVDNVPTFLPRMDALEQDTTEALVVGETHEFLIAVETDPTARNLDVPKDTFVSYYRELMHAKDCWEDDEFHYASEHCQRARRTVTSTGETAELLRLDARRHEIILTGEQVRRERGAEDARETVMEMIESFVESNDSATQALVNELQAYRFVLDAYRTSDRQSPGAVSRGYLKAIVRKLTDARDEEGNPWSTVTPHPVISTLLASMQMPPVPAAGRVDDILSNTPDYWPFLTLSEFA